MNIFYHEASRTFHLCNGFLSYLMAVLPNGQMGQIYFGRPIQDRENFNHLLERSERSMTSCVFEGNKSFSMEHFKQEYPAYGASDYRHPAIELLQADGSRITNFTYVSHTIQPGKPKLEGLPATYTDDDSEAQTLILTLVDERLNVKLELLYTLYADRPVLTRSARLINEGTSSVHVTAAMSLCLDLPDADYDWIQFSGAWGRERHPIVRRLASGIQSIESTRGHSSHNQNPFLVLKRPNTDEQAGEAIGISLVYSGNFLAQAEVDSWNTTRVLMGINPFGFNWKLNPGETFQTPEAVLVYSASGLNTMSQAFHQLYQSRLARGYWRERPRPVLVNNWEATYFDFTEEKLLHLARTAKKLGIELFVLDDGWFGARTTENAGLGDWYPNPERFPNGLPALADQIRSLGLEFGLWFEPEMVNKDSDLFRTHPDWILAAPGRNASHGRNQFVLDFSRKEVVDYIHEQMAKVLREAKLSYVKWDMNRSISEVFSAALPPDQQGEVFHRYILGVYDLYERLVTEFPKVLFESCASGGGRFDPGLLYYAPQAWTSDDTDAIERLKIQYGSSFCYPVSSMGAHVSVVPNEQIGRVTPLKTRANVAFFGAFGYELDLNDLSPEEQEEVAQQVAFWKQYREVLQFGTFYRLQSPFEPEHPAAWMVVSPDQKTALVGYYRLLNEANGPYRRIKLQGLDPSLTYEIDGKSCHGGDELMYAGLTTGSDRDHNFFADVCTCSDFDSHLFVLRAVPQL